MANSTDPYAVSVHGTNPQNLIEKILRNRIYANLWWKEHCFGLNAESLVDKACELKYAGGAYSANQKPAPFLCLVLKMLQIQPDLDIVREFIQNEDFKYVRALGAIYWRIIARPVDVHQLLEPLYNDFRRIRIRTVAGWKLSTMDQFVRDLLTEELVCDVTMPRLPPRHHLEKQGLLPPYRSALEDMSDVSSENESAPVIAPAASTASPAQYFTTSTHSTTVQQPKIGAADTTAWPTSRARNVDNRPAWATRSAEGAGPSLVAAVSPALPSGNSDSPNTIGDARTKRERSRSCSRSPDKHGGERTGVHARECRSSNCSHKRSRSETYSPGRSRSHSSSSSRSRSHSHSRSYSRSRSRSSSGKEHKKYKKHKKRKKHKKHKKHKQGKRHHEDGQMHPGLFKQTAGVSEDVASAAGENEVDEVAHWNSIRAKLGMKPLRE